MTVRIEMNRNDVASLKLALSGIRNGVPRVLTTSINKSIVTTQTQAVKAIGRRLNLPAKRIKQDFKQEKANFSKLSGALHAEGEPVGLIQFGASQVRTGVSHKVTKSASRVVTKHAFISARGSARHVFRREPDGWTRKPAVVGKKYSAMPKAYRLPIDRKTGPRIEDIYAKPIIYNATQAVAVEAFIKNVGNETTSLLRRYG